MRETTRDDALTLPEWVAFVGLRNDALLPCAAGTYEWMSENTAEQRRAAQLCRSCPVLDACRNYAIAAGEKTGVWGATTPADRRRNRRRQQAA